VEDVELVDVKLSLNLQSLIITELLIKTEKKYTKKNQNTFG